MEDDENKKDPLNSLLNSLGLSGKKQSNKQVDNLPEAYKECNMIYKSVHNTLELPIYLGVDTKENKFYIGFGNENPFLLSKEEIIYMMTALGALVSKGLEEQYGKTPEEIHKEVNSSSKDITFSKGEGYPDKATAELKKKVAEDQGFDELSEEDKQKLDEIKGNLEEVQNMQEQAEEYTKNMSPEEKSQYLKDIAKKQEELLAKKAREFERSLLGSIEEEDSITYNYDYFKDIHEKEGQAALKEELAKIPKEERQEIIDKIIQEAKLKKQQKPNDNDEKGN